MVASAVTMRYAKALFEVAEARGERAAVLSVLSEFDALLAANDELKAVLLDPRLPAAAKRKVLEPLVLDKAPAILVDFFDLCLTRGREGVLIEVGNELARLDRESRGIVVATVTSSGPLAEETRGAVKARLEEMSGKHVEMIEAVDESLIGGVQIRIGSTMWDGSVRRRLEDLEKHLEASPIG
jgi:F-type H+-transporting ATPase subunit delta